MSGRDERPVQVEAATEEEPFLSRWARLKQASRQEPAEEALPPGEQAVQLPAAAPESEEAAAPATDAPEEAAAVDLPPLDSLTEESDFGPFMRTGVDPALRRAALRKMFRNPAYGIVDELDPFRADFAAFTPLGDIITSDMKFHAERLLRKQLEQAAEAAEAAGTAPAEGGDSGQPAGQASRAVNDGDVPEAAADAPARDDPDTHAEDADERRDS